ncbi:MAG: cysteine desulfurase [Pseudomonadota bacterium]
MTADVTNLAEARRNLYDVKLVRADFPILSRRIYGKPLAYLDNGASAQKPRQVIDAMSTTLEQDYSNIHRGAHYLSQALTDKYETVRERVARFMNAARPEEIVFTRNATEAINLVASSWGHANLKAGDEIVVSVMEHHANIVPWQILETQIGIKLKVAPITDRGELMLDAFEELLTDRTKLVAMAHTSNVLGTTTPAREIVRLAHDRGIPVLLDGAQSIVHQRIDVQALDVDFYVWTGHKLYGPSGIGVLYGKHDLLDAMPPYQGGGDMIETVSFEGTTFKEPPHRFEAGTPAIVETIGLGVAIDYVDDLGIDRIAAHEQDLLDHAVEEMSLIDGMQFVGTAPGKAAIVSFNVEGIHPLDVATILDRDGVAVRVGQHCAEPLIRRMGVDATVRASFGLYNTHEEVEVFVSAIQKAKKILG